MERIAPLAKILAEANGIDWQALRGSGEGGMVVEQDILNYLSRIMSGEEEPPATPVDVPPADWNGDVNAMPDLSGLSAEQLSRAGVDADLTALLGQPSLNQPAPAPAQPELHVSPQVPATPAVTDLDADDMEFELDDEQVEPVAAAPIAAAPVASAPVVASPGAAEPSPPAASGLGTWEWNSPAPQAVAPASAPEPAPPAVQLPEIQLPDFGSPAAPAFAFQAPAPAVSAAPFAAVTLPDIQVPAVAVPAIPVPAVSVPEIAVPEIAPPAAAVPPTAAALSAPVGEASAGGLGSLLSRLYQQTPAPATPAEPAPQASVEHTTPPFSLDSMDTDLSSAALAVDEPAALPVVDMATDRPEPAIHDMTSVDVSSVAPAPIMDSAVSSSDWSAALRSAPQAAAEPLQVEPVQAEPTPLAGAYVPAPAQAPVAEPELAVTGSAEPEPVAPEPAHAESAEKAQPTVAPEAVVAPVAASEVAEQAPVAAPVGAAVAVAAAASVPHTAPAEGAVWFGTYLRRSVDLGPASDLHDQLTSALGQDVPLAFLVARAAQRHAGVLGLSSIALHDTAAHRARSVAGDHLRSALGALEYDYEGTPQLLVVDAGAVDLDELHYPHTVTLSVGRLQHGRAALTLNGDVDAAQGARFLADLDDTLSRPILLML